jgi:hypothetical protein
MDSLRVHVIRLIPTMGRVWRNLPLSRLYPAFPGNLGSSTRGGTPPPLPSLSLLPPPSLFPAINLYHTNKLDSHS